MKTPILDMLKSYKERNRISFCMPGHKNGLGLADEFSSFALDVTELADTDNLTNPKTAVLEAKKLCADFFGAYDSFFLVNGSTGGIYTMLASVCTNGDCIIISRNCHCSVINACTLLGIKPVFIEQPILDSFNIPGGINPNEIRKLIEIHNPKAVFITSPNYFGICSDLKAIAKIAHSYKIPLLVDEAHGAHFNADKNRLPLSAMACGADLCVQSAHKTLNSPNQTAFLHYNSKIIDYNRVKTVFSMLQTSSPSYLMCAAADYARAHLEKNTWNELVLKVTELKSKLSPYYKILDKSVIGNDNIFDLDISRIVINLSDYDITGFEFSEILRIRFNIDIEMQDLYNIILIPTPANSYDDFNNLFNALITIHKDLKKSENNSVSMPLPTLGYSLSPQKAFYGNTKSCPISESVGKTSASTVVCYPPGVPITAPGFIITKETVDYLVISQQAGAEISGLDENGNITVI